jgi:hypothetical protein
VRAFTRGECRRSSAEKCQQVKCFALTPREILTRAQFSICLHRQQRSKISGSALCSLAALPDAQDESAKSAAIWAMVHLTAMFPFHVERPIQDAAIMSGENPWLACS